MDRPFNQCLSVYVLLNISSISAKESVFRAQLSVWHKKRIIEIDWFRLLLEMYSVDNRL